MAIFRLKNLYSVDTTQRIEAFSDGVFAIAITLLVLEIKVPHLPHPTESQSLTRELVNLWPSYFAYVFSFLTIGIYWVNHHYIFQFYKRSDHVFAVLNVLFLMFISFLPFPTAILAQFMLDAEACKAAIPFYTLSLLLPALFWNGIWVYASSGGRLIDQKLAPAFIRFLTRQYLASVLLFGTAFGLSLVHPGLGLAIAVGLTLFYLLPSRRPSYQ